MNRIILAIVAVFIYAGTVQAEAETQALDIRLGDNSARFMYSSDVLGGSFGAANLDFGIYFDDDNDTLGNIGMFIKSESLENPFSISLGFRGYYGDVGKQPDQIPTQAAALAIGGELVFVPKNFGGFGFAVTYYIAPSVLSFMDIDRLTEFGARLEFSVTEQTKLILGYQDIEVDRADGGTVIDVTSGFIFGIGLRF
jgi:hypothetical protein